MAARTVGRWPHPGTGFFDCSRLTRVAAEYGQGCERWRPEIEASPENIERLVIGS
jgi:hypothetical protein